MHESEISRAEFVRTCLQYTGAAGFISLAFARCVTTATGKKAFILIPESQEIELGNEAFQQIMAQERRSSNRGQTEMLRRVGRQVASVSERPDYQWQFELIASKQVNAFAVPGGKVAFYEGIMPYCQNEAGVACVMGHEVGHAVARHGAQRMSQQLAAQGALSMVDLSLSRNSASRNVIMGALGVGATVGVLLPYSREHEYEADQLGLNYMAKAGYDPDEAIAFWERFAELTKGGAHPPEFLSTHPLSENRIARMKQHLPAARALYQSAPQKFGAGANV